MRLTHQKNKSGVSEIIASILTLAITVVLFASLFIWIQQMEGPNEQTYADFEADIVEVAGENNLRITHYGGETLDTWKTDVYVFDTGGSATIYNMTIGGVDTDKWDVGMVWMTPIGDAGNQSLDIAIIDSELSQTVWAGRLGGISNAVAPLILQATTSPRQIAQDQAFNATARVYDSDYNLVSVKVNLFNLGLGAAPHDLIDSDGDGVWEYTDRIPDTIPPGTYTITFTAYDDDLNTDTRTITVFIRNASELAPKVEFPFANPSEVWENYTFNVTAKITDGIDHEGNTIPTNNRLVSQNLSIPDLVGGRSMNTTEIGGVYIAATPIRAPPLNGGPSTTYEIEVFADNQHGNDTNTTSITVVSSDVPIISWAIGEPNTLTKGHETRIIASVIDQEDDVDTVTVDLSNLGATYGTVNLTRTLGTNIWRSPPIDTSNVNLSDNKYLNYTVTVNAEDRLNHNASGEPVFLRIFSPIPDVVETPPIITSINLDPNPVATNDQLNISAIVVDFQGPVGVVTVDVEGLGKFNMTSTDGRTFTATITPPQSTGPHKITIWANDTFETDGGTNSTTILDVVTEQGALIGPDIAFQDIQFSNDAPVHDPDTSVVITAWVVNLGGTNGLSSVNATIRFEDEGPEGTTIIQDVSKTIYNAPAPVFATWHPSTGGIHKIKARLLYCTPVEDVAASSSNNYTSKNITVRPSILLVDDDHAPADGSVWDTTSWMRSALRASSFIDSTTIHTVTNIDGPRWDSGDHPLIDYDIVIWMTGYETSNTLTANDRAALETFLAQNRSLWVISEGAMNDPAVIGWEWGNLTNVMHVNPGGVTNSTGPVDPVMGDDNHTVTSGKLYNITDRGPYSQGDYIAPDTYAEAMLSDGSGETIAISYNQSYKSVFFSWEFSKMLYPADQATLTYNVLLWLSGLSEWSGEDIAVAQVSASPESPDYNENFTITARFRNNGASPWSVQAGFYLDGSMLLMTDPRVNAGLSKDSILLNPGEEGDVYINMVANIAPGYHTLSVIADPDNDITETNELNNEISSDDPIFNLNLYVKFTLLVVDDDDSLNNGGSNEDVSSNITEALDFLNYTYSVFVVGVDGTGTDGPNTDELERYKGVVWMCGETDTNTLTATDQLNIRNYISNESGQLWLVGQDILWDLSGGADTSFTAGSFVYDIMHVESVEHNVLTPNPIHGVNYNEITHGMQYQTDPSLIFTDQGDRIVPTSDAEGIFWQDSLQTSYNALQWESATTDARIVFMPFEYAYLSGLFQRPLDTTTRAGTRAVIWSDGFETDDYSGGPWTEVDPDGKAQVVGNFDHTGSHSIRLRGGGTNPWIWTEKDLSSYSAATLTFWYYCDTDYGNNDEMKLWLSDDGGSNWDFISNYEIEGSWREETVDLAGYLTNNMRIAFGTDANANDEDCWIDDISIDATGAGPIITYIDVEYDPTNERETQTLYVTANGGTDFVDDIEYWSDQDATHYSMTPDNAPFGDEIEEDGSMNIDISGWSTGMHWFEARAQNDLGNWGSSDIVFFNITRDSPQTTNALSTPQPATEVSTVDISATIIDKWSNVADAEWWWETDGDQGAGNNNPMLPQDLSWDSPSEIAISTIDVSSLGLGTHRLFIRGMDENGRWNTTITDGTSYPGTFIDVGIASNLPVTSNVQVNPAPTNGATSVVVTAIVGDGESTIEKVEAFIDTDPGEDAGTPLTIPAEASQGAPPVSITPTGSMSVAALSEGTHTMYVRAKQSSDHRWGAVSSTTFQVTSPDITGPTVLITEADLNPTNGAFLVTISGTVRDLRSVVAGAEYKIGTGPWTPMNASDGSWDSLAEDVEVVLNTTTWEYGDYLIWIRGTDSGGYTGPQFPSTGYKLQVTRPPVAEKLGVQSELAFMVMKFFEHPETRPELRVVKVDLNITTQSLNSQVNPMLGDSYLVSAEIYNPGGSAASTVVKILDGSNIVATQNMYIPPHQKATLEAVWTPQHVGERNIIAEITQNANEIFTFNNQAYETLETYFFHDNMEEGTDKWEHDDTILLINGESKLDFMNPPVNSTIISTWNTSSFVATDNESHSHEYSYWIEEATGGVGQRPPIDVVFALDTSGSMSSTDMANLIQATKDFMGQLTDIDRAAIFVFDGGGSTSTADPEMLEPYAFMTAANRTLYNASVDTLTDDGYTPFYDTLGAAIQYSQTNLVAGRFEFVIGMTDGESNSDDIFTPNANWGQTVAADNEYSDSTPHPTEGLLNPPCMVFTIGLGITHDTNYPTAPSWSRTAPSGSVEYDVWNVADSSPDPLHDAGGKYGENSTTGADNVGHYYYTTDSSQLPGIFDDIYTAVLSALPAQTTTRGEDDTISRATVEKTAITDTFSLTDSSSATLSFYHKYKMALGANGGVVMVGTSPDGITWSYQYVIPKQSYPGNLLFSETEYDDVGRVVRWAYNGISAGGLFDWDYSEVDLTDYVGEQYVRVKFQYYEYGGGTGGGWWLDDIQVRVSRNDSLAGDSRDQWEYTSDASTSGLYSWVNRDATNGFKGSLDNSLYSQPIDLTNALVATLSFNTRFNFNESAGRPPDGFRVEISADNGVSWRSLTLGVRSAWGLSGSGNDLDDNISDGKSYTGLDTDGDGWVEGSTLTRLNTDISGWVGSTVILRFRVVTASDDNGFFGDTHYAVSPLSSFPGLWIDDVILRGRTTGG